MLPRKIFKIKGPRLAKNAFPEISPWKNQIKMSQHVALLLNLGVLKIVCWLWERGAISPLAPSSYSPDIIEFVSQASKTLRVFDLTSTLS